MNRVESELSGDKMPDYMNNVLRTKLDRGEPTLGTHLSVLDPMVVETVGRTGLFDYVEIVVEYGTYDLPTLENIARAAELYSMGTMIKVHGDDWILAAQRSVAAGFESVLFSEPRSAEDVSRCVRSVRPDTPEDGGLRGIGSRRFLQPGYTNSETYLNRLRETVVAVMIEKASAVEALDEILQVPGIDMVVFGAMDYSTNIGRPGEAGSKIVLDAGERVIQACHTAGVRFRAEVESIDEVQYFLDLGVRDFCFGGDLRILYSSLKQSGNKVRELLSDSFVTTP
jgi:2-keto-3-deoxy-L-rhamnonate aldolase RhmA